VPTAVSFDHVTKRFAQRGKPDHTAVDDVAFDIEAGEIFGIIGYSGAGKSTLVRLINALETPTSGRVIVHGDDLSAQSGAQLRRIRSGIGMIFQQFNLFESRTVAANIEYPLKLAGWDRDRRRQRIAELLDFVSIPDKAGAYPGELSGGQKQRVGIARALATEPKLLLADEATSALDPETTNDVLGLLKRVNAELGITIVAITHEMHVVREIADRVAVMDSGRIVELGGVYQVFSHPQAETTKRFLRTVLTEVPTPEVLSTLRSRYPRQRLFTVDVRDDDRTSGLLSRSSHEFGVDVAVVFGGIGELQGRPFGSLTFTLDGPPDRTQALLDAVSQSAHLQEVTR
jgi:D-methionine transport system ATP-binding protein